MSEEEERITKNERRNGEQLLISAQALSQRHGLRVYFVWRLRQQGLFPCYLLPERCYRYNPWEWDVLVPFFPVTARQVIEPTGARFGSACSTDYLTKRGLGHRFALSLRQVDVYRTTGMFSCSQHSRKPLLFHVCSCDAEIMKYRLPGHPELENLLQRAKFAPLNEIADFAAMAMKAAWPKDARTNVEGALWDTRGK